MLKVAGSRFEGTDAVLRKLRADAMSIGADSIFSVTTNQTVRTQGELLLELDPKNKPTVYSSEVVTGMAARCATTEGHDGRSLVTKPPDSPAGYVFGEKMPEVQARCVEQGYAFSWSKEDAVCDGTPASIGLPGRMGFGFCNDKLCRVDVVGRIGARMDIPWRTEFERLSGTLAKRYGKPQHRDSTVPTDCKGDVFLKCLSGLRASHRHRWHWPDGTVLWLLLTGDSGAPALRVLYDASNRKEPKPVPAL